MLFGKAQNCVGDWKILRRSQAAVKGFKLRPCCHGVQTEQNDGPYPRKETTNVQKTHEINRNCTFHRSQYRCIASERSVDELGVAQYAMLCSFGRYGT